MSGAPRGRAGAPGLQALLATCEVVALEVLYSARNIGDYDTLAGALRAPPWLPVTADATASALEVQHSLARRGQHRLPIPDLLIAATAEVHQATVLHDDRDFDRIGAVTASRRSGSLRRGGLSDLWSTRAAVMRRGS